MNTPTRYRQLLRRLVLLAACALPSLPLHAETSADGAWTTESAKEFAARRAPGAEPWVHPTRYQPLELAPDTLETLLRQAPPESADRKAVAASVLLLPTPEGDFEPFEVVESPVMEPELAAWLAAQGWPMKTYKAVSLDHPETTARLDWGGPGGFHAMVSRPGDNWFIDPAWRGNRQTYLSYFKRDYPRGDKQFSCGVAGEETITKQPVRAGTGTGGNLRSYRTAVAATGEYTSFHGGAVSAQAAIVTTVNRVNQVYERDLSLRLVLIGNNSSIVYTNSATDPYTNSDGGTMLGENQANLDSLIGSANYDLGHVVSTGGGGIASLGSTCWSSEKAQGVTGSSSPVGDPFDIDYVAHEMGHQLGGNHTFNSVTGSCGGGNRNAGTAYEPGSGTTIQAYAGICDADDVQPHSDAYFHGISLDEMLNHLGSSGNCWTTSSASNPHAPTVSAGADYTVPVNTPFALTALNGADLDGDTLTYVWEEFDLGAATTLAAADNGASPLLRSWSPSSSPVRTVPRLENLLAGTLPVGEKLPTTNRTMNFRVTVRDNHAGGGRLGEDSMTVTTSTSAGPFRVTYPNGGESISNATTPTITWNVAGTTGAPVSTANVNILLSVDGGLTYPYTLLSATPNDGSAAVTLPTGVTSSSARIRVQGAGNIFFDISDADFTITGGASGGSTTISQCDAPGSTIPATSGTVIRTITLTGTQKISDLNLTLNISHTWVGDLQITLARSGGPSVMVLDRPGVPALGADGCNADDINATLDDEGSGAAENQCSGTPPAIGGTVTPNNPLSAFDGYDIGGTWTLTLSDQVSGDGGTLNQWCISATTQATGTQCTNGLLTLTTPGYTSGSYDLSSQSGITTDTTGSVTVASGVQMALTAPTVSFEPSFTAASGSSLTATAGSVTCP